MKIKNQLSDTVTLRELGARLAAQRLALNLTQAELSEEAGVPKRTIERLEAGAAATRLSAFLRVCRVLGLQERLEQLVPEPAPSPVAQLKLQGRTRKRASKRPAADATQHPLDPLKGSTKRARWTWEP